MELELNTNCFFFNCKSWNCAG